MRNIKKVMGILVLALVATLGTPQAFGNDGAVELPGRTVVKVEAESTGAVELPGVAVMILQYIVSML